MCVADVAVPGSCESLWLLPDLFAVLNSGALLVPQWLRYASLAGMQTMSGLSASRGAFAFSRLCGWSRDLDVGREPTVAIMVRGPHWPGRSLGPRHPDRVTKAAVLCTRIVKNSPLQDNCRRVGFVCMIEFCLRNGLTWTPPPGDEDGKASARVVPELAAGSGDEDAIAALAEWIRERTAS